MRGPMFQFGKRNLLLVLKMFQSDLFFFGDSLLLPGRIRLYCESQVVEEGVLAWRVEGLFWVPLCPSPVSLISFQLWRPYFYLSFSLSLSRKGLRRPFCPLV